MLGWPGTENYMVLNGQGAWQDINNLFGLNYGRVCEAPTLDPGSRAILDEGQKQLAQRSGKYVLSRLRVNYKRYFD